MYKAKFRGTPVAVKRLHNINSDKLQDEIAILRFVTAVSVISIMVVLVIALLVTV